MFSFLHPVIFVHKLTFALSPDISPIFPIPPQDHPTLTSVYLIVLEWYDLVTLDTMPRKIAIIAHSPGRTQDFNWLGILKLIVWAVTVALGTVGHGRLSLVTATNAQNNVHINIPAGQL